MVDEQSIRRSLDLGEIVPFFQPIRELRTGRLMGFELLARWEHPEKGTVAPSSFIPVAEDAGLLTMLTERILTPAFQAMREQPESLTLAVNMSPLQLQDLDTPYRIIQAAKENDFPLHRLTIEITETALVDNLPRAKEITQKLKRMGCKVLLDDFGTGFSSLTHLRMMHFDGLKIDRSFVSSITTVREDRKIVAALVGLGQSLGITTTAEGIETEEQARLLLYLGCDMGQGYFYGRPGSASTLSNVVRAAPAAVTVKHSLPGEAPRLASLESPPVERVAQLQAIYDGAPVGLCYLNRELRYVSVNRCMAEIDNTTIMSMVGHTVQTVFPVWFPLYRPYLRRALQGESLRDIELTRPSLHEDGSEQVILFSCEPAKDEADEVIGISISVLDITQRKMAERKLAESERQFRTILDLNPETPWVMDRDGKILDYGRRWELLTGFSRAEIIDMGYLSTILEEDRNRVMQITQRALTTGDPLEYECRARRFDGTWFWIRVRGKAIFGRDGKVWRYYGSTEDVDELKRLREIVKAAGLRLPERG